jgi:hypothetical protein
MPEEMKLEISPKLKQIQTMMGAMKLAEFMSLSQGDYEKLIGEIENDPLFKKLMQPDKFPSPKDRLINYRKFPGTRLSKRYFSELNLSITPDRGSSDLDSLIERGKDVTPLIKSLGVDKFKKYFLEVSTETTLEEIAGECQLSLGEVKKINSFLDTFYIQSEFDHFREDDQVSRLTFSTVASIEEGEDGFGLGYFSRDFVKGRYSINYEKFEELKKSRRFGNKEMRAIEALFNKLRLVNTREATLYKIIQSIIEIQGDYLKSGAPRDFSRAISRKAIATPKGGEIPLKFFFPSRKGILKKFIWEVIEKEKKPYSDEKIKERLKKDYEVSLSRRSVREYRALLKIPSSRSRKNEKIYF